ncbi:hypothetical protein HMPREF9442_01996 [Paraprevotella xylaniphila YIT 11841]|uniref:Uncharacterized protein n=1 Tax=Paraprevotella xylaniphila YIT 11841 TaxID=762982 RepID=F3QUX1_9BACT|nr:hypothetical protein HMPREF9442_01996 [Paraprevotella xylaniphila YIT 11841]
MQDWKSGIIVYRLLYSVQKYEYFFRNPSYFCYKKHLFYDLSVKAICCVKGGSRQEVARYSSIRKLHFHLPLRPPFTTFAFITGFWDEIRKDE